MTGRFDVYETIDRIRHRPAMYLGLYSLTRLQAFLNGCMYAAAECGAELVEQPEFGGFHDWVAMYYGRFESTAGWCNIILQEAGGDEAAALARFFELVDEYRR